MKYVFPIAGLLIRPPDKYAVEGGVFGAARSRAGRSREHEGIDICTTPGQPILLPTIARFIRIADPYPDKIDKQLLGGLYGTQDGMMIKILYFRPIVGGGGWLPAGTLIGYAQDLEHLYPGITDHIHVEVYNKDGDKIDPTPFFFNEGGGNDHPNGSGSGDAGNAVA